MLNCLRSARRKSNSWRNIAIALIKPQVGYGSSTCPQRLKSPAMKRVFPLVLGLLATCPGSNQSHFITGMTMIGGGTNGCPVLIGGVMAGSPAEKAGIKSGDVLVAVNGASIDTADDAAKLVRSESEAPVRLQLARDDKPFDLIVGKQDRSLLFEKSGQKIIDVQGGMIVPMDATETEMTGKLRTITPDRFVDRVFPSHYPTNEKLYYAGFELLILNSPAQVVVLGIEDGPASRAGVHWGDTIVSVNGVDPRNKTVKELESLFSSETPVKMNLKIERNGVMKTYVIELAQAAQVLQDNGTRLLEGHPIPAGIPEKYLRCFQHPKG